MISRSKIAQQAPLVGKKLKELHEIINDRDQTLARQEKIIQKQADLIKHYKTLEPWIDPGHFYSPLTKDTNFKHFMNRNNIPDIDLNENKQKQLAHRIYKNYKFLPYKDNKSGKYNYRYYYNNDQFSYSDAITLFCMLYDKKPNNIIEVGSGYSSAIMLDVNEYFKGNSKLTFIEPYPVRLNRLISSKDAETTIVEKFVQDIDLTVFSSLNAGDILFIDSSHVGKAGSDVNWLYFEVLPLIKSGVIIHIHDIFYPFEYLDEWIKQGRSWNEAYLLRSLLMGNRDFEIILWPNYLHKFYPEVFSNLPQMKKNIGGSIWIQKK